MRTRRPSTPEERARRRVYDAAHREKNRSRIRAYHAGWRARNRHRVRAICARWDRAHKKDRKAARKRPGARMMTRVRWQNWRARAKGVDGRITAGQMQRLLMRWASRCAYCGVPLDATPGAWDLDHVIPLALGGGHGIANLVPACAGCNERKRDDIWIPGVNVAGLTPAGASDDETAMFWIKEGGRA